MARPEVTGHHPGAPDKIEPANRDAYSVEAFARAHSLSVAMFYKLRAQGLAPACFKVGARTLISREAAARWRAAREQAAAADERERKIPSRSRTNSVHGRSSEMDDDIPF
jgi:hypothetical protein